MATFLRIGPQSIRGLLRFSFSPRVSFSRLKLLTTAASVPRSGQRLKSYNNGSETSRYHGNSRNYFDQLQTTIARQVKDLKVIFPFHPVTETSYAIWSLFSKTNEGFLRHDSTSTPGKVVFDGSCGPSCLNALFQALEVPSGRHPERLLFQLFAAGNDGKRVILAHHRDTDVLVTELYNEDKHSTDQRSYFEPEYFWSYTLFKNMLHGKYMASDAAGNVTLVTQEEYSTYPSPRTLFVLTRKNLEVASASGSEKKEISYALSNSK